MRIHVPVQIYFWRNVHNFLKWNPIQKPKQEVRVFKLFNLISFFFRVLKLFAKGLLTHGEHLEKGFRNRIQELGNGFDTVFQNEAADKDQNQDQDQDQNQKKIFMSGTPKTSKSLESSVKANAKNVLQFLNEKIGRAYRVVDKNLKLIIARLRSGVTLGEHRRSKFKPGIRSVHKKFHIVQFALKNISARKHIH